jgi:hypothetical protein
LASSLILSRSGLLSRLSTPFFNIFGYTATLGALTEMEARELINSSPIPFPEEDIEWILAESGLCPLLLQILCRGNVYLVWKMEEVGKIGERKDCNR